MNNALFGHRLRTYRKEKGLTIEKLAEQVGLSPNYLGDVERGKKTAQHGDLYPPGQCAGHLGRRAAEG